MTIFTPENEAITAQRARGQGAVSKPTDFSENFSSAFDSFMTTDRIGASKRKLFTEIDNARRFVKSRTGTSLDQPLRSGTFLPEFLQPRSDTEKTVIESPIKDPVTLVYDTFFRQNDLSESERLAKFDAELTSIRNGLPDDEKDLLPTINQMRQRIKEKSRDIVRKAEDVGSRSTPAGAIGNFAGTAVAAITEPSVAATMFIGAPVRAGLFAKMLIEAGIGSATEAVIQPDIQKQRAELGLPSGLNQAIGNIAIAGVGAAGLTGVVSSLARAVKAIRKGGVKEFEKRVQRTATKEESAIIEAHQRDLDVEDATPYKENTPKADQVYRANSQAATDAAIEGRVLQDSEIIKDDSLTLKTLDEVDSSTGNVGINQPRVEVSTKLVLGDETKPRAKGKAPVTTQPEPKIITQNKRQKSPASWVIRDKETKQVIFETFDKKKVAALNKKKFEAVPILDYLVSINGRQKPVIKVTGTPVGTAKLQKKAASIDTGPLERKKVISELEKSGVDNITPNKVDEVLSIRAREDISIPAAFERTNIRAGQAPELLPVDRNVLDSFGTPASKTSIDQVNDIIDEFADLDINDELNLLDIPIGERLTSDGKLVVETRTLKQMLDDIKEDDNFLEELKLCKGSTDVS